MKTRLLKRLRRFAKRRVWIHYYNSEYEIIEEIEPNGCFARAKGIESLYLAKQTLDRYRWNWIYHTRNLVSYENKTA